MPQVPAATRTLRVLRFLASQPDPVPLDRIQRACELPRSSAYHLLAAMAAEGFVVHLPDEHRWGLGVAAFEVGSGWARQAPLQRIARRGIEALALRTGHAAHLAVLHGRDVLYVLEQRPPGQALVTDVGVRLPAQLTASGRAMLAALAPAQVRALWPSAADLVERHGRGPATPAALRAALVDTRRRGFAVERGEVTPGLASVAAAVLDHTGHPAAAVTLTVDEEHLDESALAREARRTAGVLAERLSGRLATV